MLSLYNEKPISISINSKNRIKVEFCNVKMSLNPCQFRIFHNYLMGMSKSLNSSNDQVSRPRVNGSDMKGISDPNDDLKFNMIINDGPEEYIDWFKQLASNF